MCDGVDLSSSIIATNRARHWSRGSPRRGRWMFLATVALLAVYFTNSNIRTWHWSTRYLLFQVDMEKWPRSVKTQHQWATVLHKDNRLEEALVHYRNSLEIFDDNALTDYCIASIMIELNRFEEA